MKFITFVLLSGQYLPWTPPHRTQLSVKLGDSGLKSEVNFGTYPYKLGKDWKARERIIAQTKSKFTVGSGEFIS